MEIPIERQGFPINNILHIPTLKPNIIYHALYQAAKQLRYTLFLRLASGKCEITTLCEFSY